MKRSILTISAASLIALAALAGTANAQSTRNVAPNNIAPPNVGPTPTPSQCIAVTLAGSTFVRICNGGYSARLGATQCGGPAYGGGGNFTLPAGGCNDGQQFLGGNLSCNGTVCNWTPSPAGFAAGFQPETVYAQYQ